MDRRIRSTVLQNERRAVLRSRARSRLEDTHKISINWVHSYLCVREQSIPTASATAVLISAAYVLPVFRAETFCQSPENRVPVVG